MTKEQRRERLDEIDRQYPYITRMPPDIREEHLRLSIELVADVWQKRRIKTGTIHSYLYPGEKPGAG